MAIDLTDVASGIGGFVLHGAEASDLSGCSVSSAGDVNGDGFDDLLIGARNGDGPGDRPGGGDTYVVFGRASGFAAEIDLAAVAIGIGGFVIHGEQEGDSSGARVASAGDINATVSTTSLSEPATATAPATFAKVQATAMSCLA